MRRTNLCKAFSFELLSRMWKLPIVNFFSGSAMNGLNTFSFSTSSAVQPDSARKRKKMR